MDDSNPKHRHIIERLKKDLMMFIATTRPDGRPHLVPVWFLWDGSHVIIFSEPDKQKVRNLRHNPHVMLALETVNDGDDAVLIEGEASLVDEANEPWLSPTMPDYAEKYHALFKRMNFTAEQMAGLYTQAIRIRPIRLLNW